MPSSVKVKLQESKRAYPDSKKKSYVRRTDEEHTRLIGDPGAGGGVLAPTGNLELSPVGWSRPAGGRQAGEGSAHQPPPLCAKSSGGTCQLARGSIRTAALRPEVCEAPSVGPKADPVGMFCCAACADDETFMKPPHFLPRGPGKEDPTSWGAWGARLRPLSSRALAAQPQLQSLCCPARVPKVTRETEPRTQIGQASDRDRADRGESSDLPVTILSQPGPHEQKYM